MASLVYESIFGKKILNMVEKTRYYHCIKMENKDLYECKDVPGIHRIIPVYADIPVSKDIIVLEGVLRAPVKIVS